MAGFEHKPLGEVLGERGYIRGPFGSALVRRELLDHGIPIYEQQHAITGAREFRFFVDEKKFKELSRFQVRPNDLIISCSGTIGRISVIQPNDPIGIISQALLILRPQTDQILPAFLYYFLQTPQGQHALVQASHGSVQVNIAPRAVVERIEVPIPSPHEQRVIAHILGTLDNKIELNRRMNETLEEMARAIFKSWFVDFDPVRARAEGRDPGLPEHIADLFPDRFEDSELGEIPAGWSVEPLDQIAQFLNGLALQKYPPEGDEYLPAIKIAELRKGVTASSGRASTAIPSQYIVENGDLLFSWSGSLEVKLWTGGRGALNQHLFKVSSDRYPKWFYYYWIEQHLLQFRMIAADKATTMGHIKRHHLTEALTIVPPNPALEMMSVTMEPLVNKMLNNDLESRTLAAIRDALLPRLISGELRVPDAGRVVEEASPGPAAR